MQAQNVFRPNIGFSLFSRDGSELCRGFMVRRIERKAGEIVEICFAAMNDGTIYRSEERRASDSFDHAGEAWIKVDGIPEEAEFIGNYPLPKIRREAFQYSRASQPMVCSIDLGLPLVVSSGGAALNEIFFDAMWSACGKAGILPLGYDVALMGGEPYGFWF